MTEINREYYNGLEYSLKQLLKIPSVMGEPQKGMPFGKETYLALKFMLDLGQSMGFKTKDVDGYAGHIEWGEGSEIFGVLCHLDVVPAGEGWTYPPYKAQTHNGRIYARGALDNKGPAVAVLYAVNRLKNEGFLPQKKFRLILGLNEESGWKCIDYYMKNQPMPDSGFSPDADFPVINREKGVLFIKAAFDIKDQKISKMCGGTRVNMVPDNAHFIYDGVKQCFSGVSAHGSHPEKGVNALHKMFEKLKEKTADKAVYDIYKYFCSGNLEHCGLNIQDAPSGKLTLNLGVLEFIDRKAVLSLDIRFPVTYKREDIENLLKKNLPPSCKISVAGYHRPLYIPQDDELIVKLLQAYNYVTGQKGECISVGGATYSRALDRCVAFGPVFPDDESKIHTADEYIETEKLYKMTEIYYRALKSLL